MKYQELTHQIIEAAYCVQKVLGYGFLEKIYKNALIIELKKRGILAESERPLKIQYESEIVGDYVCDIVVEDKVILELKAVKEINEVHEVQQNVMAEQSVCHHLWPVSNEVLNTDFTQGKIEHFINI